MIYWILHTIILSALATSFYRQFNFGFPTWMFITSLLLKLAAGIAVGWIFYNYYQRGDTIVFFEASKNIASLSIQDYFSTLFSPSNYSTTSQPRVLYFTKFLSFFTLITGDSYWISSLYLSMISFFATWYFVIHLAELYPSNKTAIIISFLFIPTVIFWSSGVLKDTLAFAGFVFAIGIAIKLYHKKKIVFTEWLVCLFAVFILYKVKHYLLISIIIFNGILLFSMLIKMSGLRSKVIAILFAIAAVVSTQFVHPYLKIDRLALTIYETNKAILEKTDIDNRLNISIDSPNIGGIIGAVPSAVQIGLFRPSIFDKSTIWGWFHRIENTLLMLLFVASILLCFKLKPQADWPLILSSSITILILATLLGLATPNFGTLVRYKNAFVPFLFLLCSILPYKYFIAKKLS